MSPKTAEAERRRRADDDVQRAVGSILTRERCRIPDALALEIHQAYTGRGWYPLDDPHCTEHPSIKRPCPLCPRTPEDTEDA